MVGPVHFEELSPAHFERLCFAYLLSAEKWHDDEIDWYGQLGGDGGRDIWGVHADLKTHCYQCANHQRLKARKAKEDIDKIVKGPKGVPDRFTVIAGGLVSATTRDQIVSYAKSQGIRSANVWSGPEFEERVRKERPDLLQRMLAGELFPETALDLRTFVSADVSTNNVLPEPIVAAFAAMERRRQEEQRRAANCTDAKARKDFAEARRLLAHALFPVREDAYRKLKEHIHCRHRASMARLLIHVWESRTSFGEQDKCEILRLLGWAEVWGHRKKLMEYFLAGAQTFRTELLSGFQGFFFDAIRRDDGRSLSLVLQTLLELSKGEPPNQPTGTLLTLVEQLVRDDRKVLLPDHWEKIATISRHFEPTGDRFTQLVSIRRALSGA